MAVRPLSRDGHAEPPAWKPAAVTGVGARVIGEESDATGGPHQRGLRCLEPSDRDRPAGRLDPAAGTVGRVVRDHVTAPVMDSVPPRLNTPPPEPLVPVARLLSMTSCGTARSERSPAPQMPPPPLVWTAFPRASLLLDKRGAAGRRRDDDNRRVASAVDAATVDPGRRCPVTSTLVKVAELPGLEVDRAARVRGRGVPPAPALPFCKMSPREQLTTLSGPVPERRVEVEDPARVPLALIVTRPAVPESRQS